jgi:hypothetical protein
LAVAVRLLRLVKTLYLVLLHQLVVVRVLTRLVALVALAVAVGTVVLAALEYLDKAMLAVFLLLVVLVFAWLVAVAVQEQLVAVLHQTLLVE